MVTKLIYGAYSLSFVGFYDAASCLFRALQGALAFAATVCSTSSSNVGATNSLDTGFGLLYIVVLYPDL